ncbi:hypothetical protein X975_11946, partial [Stegodyphus mimosarum]
MYQVEQPRLYKVCRKTFGRTNHLSNILMQAGITSCSVTKFHCSSLCRELGLTCESKFFHIQ